MRHLPAPLITAIRTIIAADISHHSGADTPTTTFSWWRTQTPLSWSNLKKMKSLNNRVKSLCACAHAHCHTHTQSILQAFWWENSEGSASLPKWRSYILNQIHVCFLSLALSVWVCSCVCVPHPHRHIFRLLPRLSGSLTYTIFTLLIRHRSAALLCLDSPILVEKGEKIKAPWKNAIKNKIFTWATSVAAAKNETALAVYSNREITSL